MTKSYLVMFEIEEGEMMYASAENPFTYESKPIIFDDKNLAEQHAKSYNTGIVIEQDDIRPFNRSERLRAKVRELLNKPEW
jgi:hypothetical protein